MKKSLWFLLPLALVAIACGGAAPSTSSAPAPQVEVKAPGNVHAMRYESPQVILVTERGNWSRYTWERRIIPELQSSNKMPNANYFQVLFANSFGHNYDNTGATDRFMSWDGALVIMDWETDYPDDIAPTDFIQGVRNYADAWVNYEWPVPQITQWLESTPIVVISSDPVVTQAALAAGATEVIPKDSTPEDLEALIVKYQNLRYPCVGDPWDPANYCTAQ